MTNDSKNGDEALERPEEGVTADERPLPEAMQAAMASPSRVRNFAITGLFVLAIFYTLYFAPDFVLPVALALLMSLLLLPLVSLLAKVKIPEAIGSAVSIVLLILTLAGLATTIYQPATSFLQDFPHHLRQIQERLTFLSASLKEAGHTSPAEQGKRQESQLLMVKCLVLSDTRILDRLDRPESWSGNRFQFT
jgi:predicted PurR-regulated permease PerM